MSDHGAAKDQSRDDARKASYNCPYCSGEGMCEVFDRRFDGITRVMRREVEERGEIRTRMVTMVVAAHCVCRMGQWVRSKTRPEDLPKIPDLAAILAGQSRWTAQDPTRDADGWPIGPAPRAPGTARGMADSLATRGDTR